MFLFFNGTQIVKPKEIHQKVQNESLFFNFETQLQFSIQQNLLKHPLVIFPIFQSTKGSLINSIKVNLIDTQQILSIDKKPTTVSSFSFPLTNYLQHFMCPELLYLVSIPLPEIINNSNFTVIVNSIMFIEPDPIFSTLTIPFYVKDFGQHSISGCITSIDQIGSFNAISSNEIIMSLNLDQSTNTAHFNEFFPDISQIDHTKKKRSSVITIKIHYNEHLSLQTKGRSTLTKLVHPPKFTKTTNKEIIFVIDFSARKTLMENKSTLIRFLNYFIFSMPLQFMFNVAILTDLSKTPTLLFSQSQMLSNESWKQFVAFVSSKLVPLLIPHTQHTQPISHFSLDQLFQLLQIPPVNERHVFLFVENSLPPNFIVPQFHQNCHVYAFGLCHQISFHGITFEPFQSSELFFQNLDEKLSHFLDLPKWHLDSCSSDSAEAVRTFGSFNSFDTFDAFNAIDALVQSFSSNQPNFKPCFFINNRLSTYFKNKSPVWWEQPMDRIFKHLLPDQIVDANHNESIDKISDVIGVKCQKFNQQLIMSLIFSFLNQNWVTNLGPLRNRVLLKIYMAIKVITDNQPLNTIFMADYVLKNANEINQHLTRSEHNNRVPQSYFQTEHQKFLHHNQHLRF